MEPRRLRWGLVLFLAGCAQPGADVVPLPPPIYFVGYEETGAASWDGQPSQGRRAAGRKVYAVSQMTAAHRSLPVGSRVVVENLLNRQAAEVGITGRGPSTGPGILDLSEAAARVLGAVEPGVIPVRLRVTALAGSPPLGRSRTFSVQVASFASAYRAAVLKEILDRTWVGTYVQPQEAGGQTFYRVRVGTYASRREAQRLALRLAAAGYPVIVMEE